MSMYRFTRAHQWARSEARLAQKFAKGINEDRIAYLQDSGGNTVMGGLTRIYVGSYGEGQKLLQDFLPGDSKEYREARSDQIVQESNTSRESPTTLTRH